MTAEPSTPTTALRAASPGARPAACDPIRMRRPEPRGPVSTAVLDILREPPGAAPHGRTPDDALRVLKDTAISAPPRGSAAPGPHASTPADADLPWALTEDAQLALLALYELHYRGLDGVDDRWEWDPDLLRLRAAIEGPFEAALRARVPVPACPRRDAAGVAARLFELAAEDGPGLSSYVAKRADVDQVREFLMLKSVYQLKEADPHTWAVPRLVGAPKAALVEIQADEYGGGQAGRMHAELFARALRGAGLDEAYGAYLDVAPGPVLVAANTMSLFGLHRRLRGALVGHLAAFEMTSSLPNRLYGNGLRRLGYDRDTTWYFDEHVEADAVHEQIAGHDLAGRLAEQQPALVADILFGAAACLRVESDVAVHALGAWRQGRSALRPRQG